MDEHNRKFDGPLAYEPTMNWQHVEPEDFAPTHVMEVPDLSGFDLPDPTSDTEPPPDFTRELSPEEAAKVLGMPADTQPPPSAALRAMPLPSPPSLPRPMPMAAPMAPTSPMAPTAPSPASPGPRPPMVSHVVEIPYQAEGLSEQARLLLVLLAVGMILALASAALALLIGF